MCVAMSIIVVQRYEVFLKFPNFMAIIYLVNVKMCLLDILMIIS
jgi:hypothetical protein